MRASRTTPIGASSRCTATSCSACPSRKFEHLLSAKRLMTGAATDAELDGVDASQSRRRVQGARARADGAGVPDGPDGPAVGRDRSRVAFMDAQEGGRLPAREQHLRDARHRRQHRVDGVRQPRRRFRNGRGVHAKSIDGREEVLRRVPHQRAGRGRRRRNSHAAQHRRDGQSACRSRTRSCVARKNGWRITSTTCRTSSSPSSADDSISCRRAPASARPPRRCASRPTWSTRD